MKMEQLEPKGLPVGIESGIIKLILSTGFPILTCPVEESQPPSGKIGGATGRIAWSAELDGKPDEKVAVYHAWLVEDLEGGRVRILTQESQSGKPAAE